MHVIIVRIKIKPEFVETFEAAMKDHIRATRASEPGCLQFDVAVDKDDPRTYHLYEVYADDAAIAQHAKSPSLAALREKLQDWVEDRALHNATRWPEVR